MEVEPAEPGGDPGALVYLKSTKSGPALQTKPRLCGAYGPVRQVARVSTFGLGPVQQEYAGYGYLTLTYLRNCYRIATVVTIGRGVITMCGII